MLNNPLAYLGLFAALTGVSLPKTLEQDWLLVPNHAVAVPANQALLPVPVLRTVPRKVDMDLGPTISAKAAIVMDADSGMVLWQKDPDSAFPIASVTKLMTALVANDSIQNWDDAYTLQGSDLAVGGSQFRGQAGDAFSKRDLLKAALVGSINQAAAAVAHSTGLDDAQFVAAMNAKADHLGMTNSTFVEPTGLKAGNVSSVRDLALLLKSVQQQPVFMEPLSQTVHKMQPTTGGSELTITTTNDLIRDDAPFVVAGKTGFTDEAGYCLTTVAQDSEGNTILVVVLGADTETARFSETSELIGWSFGHYNWP